MLDPGLVKKRRAHLCRVDRRTCVVMRSGKALPLGVVSFAVFNALHVSNGSGWHRGPKRLTRDQIYSIVYAGVVDPPQPTTLTQIIWQLKRNIAYLGLTVRCYGKGRRSAWVLEALPVC